MKTVGLITIHDIVNCGSSLQTYATQTVVESLGYDCTIIDYKYPNKYHNDIINKGIESNKSFIYNIVRRLYHIIKPQHKTDAKRKSVYQPFWDKYYKLTRPYTSIKDIEENISDFDIYLAGSDQIWNSKYIFGDTTWLLPYVADDKLKISYASSFGSSVINEQYKHTYKKYLSRFNVLSTRENSGIQIIKELTGKDAKQVLDPTLLLDADQWNKIALAEPINNGRPYILCYLLSYAIDPFPYVYDLIERIKTKYGYDVIFLSKGNKVEFEKRGYSLAGLVSPDKFLSYFRDASFVITSSFHGTVFSLNYEKPFYSIVNPNITDDRIESMIQAIGAHSRQLPIGSVLPSSDDFEMDYSEITPRLEMERKRSIEYLRSALNGEECKLINL